MKRLRALLAGLALAPSPAFASVPEGAAPMAVAWSFLTAVKRKDCDRAWTYFSSDTQARIEEESRAEIERAPYYAESFAPRRLYCAPTYAHRFDQYDSWSLRLKRLENGRATVKVNRLVDAGFRMPGFFPTRKDIVETEMHLVEENGVWKIYVAAEE